MKIIKRQDVELNLPYYVDNWNLDIGNGVFVMTRSLSSEDLQQLSENGFIDLPDELIIYMKPGHAAVLAIKEGTKAHISSIFPATDGDLAVDVVVEIEEVQFIEVPVVEE